MDVLALVPIAVQNGLMGCGLLLVRTTTLNLQSSETPIRTKAAKTPLRILPNVRVLDTCQQQTFQAWHISMLGRSESKYCHCGNCKCQHDLLPTCNTKIFAKRDRLQSDKKAEVRQPQDFDVIRV